MFDVSNREKSPTRGREATTAQFTVCCGLAMLDKIHIFSPKWLLYARPSGKDKTTVLYLRAELDSAAVAQAVRPTSACCCIRLKKQTKSLNRAAWRQRQVQISFWERKPDLACLNVTRAWCVSSMFPA